jgi:hypothetical protein
MTLRSFTRIFLIACLLFSAVDPDLFAQKRRSSSSSRSYSKPKSYSSKSYSKKSYSKKSAKKSYSSKSSSRKKSSASLCGATTNKGTRCKRGQQAGSTYCWQHARMYEPEEEEPEEESEEEDEQDEEQ